MDDKTARRMHRLLAGGKLRRPELDTIRESVLDQIEREEGRRARVIPLWIGGAVAAAAAVLIVVGVPGVVPQHVDEEGPSASEQHFRGQLVWTSTRQTLQPCASSEVYWVRVLAANPNFIFSRRVQSLLQPDPNAPLIADLEGRLEATTSGGPEYRVDKTLVVSRVRSVELGTCPR